MQNSCVSVASVCITLACATQVANQSEPTKPGTKQPNLCNASSCCKVAASACGFLPSAQDWMAFASELCTFALHVPAITCPKPHKGRMPGEHGCREVSGLADNILGSACMSSPPGFWANKLTCQLVSKSRSTATAHLGKVSDSLLVLRGPA